MKTINKRTFATLAALAVALLFQPSIARADDQRGGDNERGDRDHRDAKCTFTKWIVDNPNMPGLIYNMAGIVGGAVGDGIFTGEVLFRSVIGGVTKIVAFYHFTGLKHSFTALVQVEATGSKAGSTAVITGIVTEGWLKGHAVKGEYTVITCDHVGPSPNCFEGTLKIDRDSND
jgi:hypothetical protein